MSEERFRPLRALRALLDHNVRFVLIGGMAGRARGSPSVTGDVDVCYSRDAANLQAMARALRSIHARLRGAAPDVPFILDAKSLYEGDRFTFATDHGSVDIMGAPDGAPGGFAALDLAAESMELEEGVFVRVAALDDLMRMKRAAGRPKDLIELEVLGALREEIDAQAAAERERRRRERRSR